MYPYKFTPLLKQAIWGGSRILPFKQLDLDIEKVGESWEISGVEGYESVVAEGKEQGISISNLIAKHGSSLVGEANYARFGTRFPLLLKFIDAEQDLSVQVHPNDALAQKLHGTFGKTEMWYVIDADTQTKLYTGFEEEVTPEEYDEYVKNNTLIDVLKQHTIKRGAAFFLPAGRIHSIGAGSFIAEIQQTSDITYRIYDYNRRDKNGELRQLHTDLAKKAIDYTVADDYRTDYNRLSNEPIELISCPYFTTTLYDFTEPILCDYSELDSFVVYMVVAGCATLYCDGKYELTLQTGETVLFPALTREVEIIPSSKGVKFLEIYV